MFPVAWLYLSLGDLPHHLTCLCNPGSIFFLKTSYMLVCVTHCLCCAFQLIHLGHLCLIPTTNAFISEECYLFKQRDSLAWLDFRYFILSREKTFVCLPQIYKRHCGQCVQKNVFLVEDVFWSNAFPRPLHTSCVNEKCLYVICSDQNSSNTRTQQDTHLPQQQSKDAEGDFHLLIKELKLYHRWFRTHFRMSMGQFEALSQPLVPHLRRKSGD